MKRGIFAVVALAALLTSSVSAQDQKDIRNFIFGHSLIHHEFQLNPTPSQETSVPYWFQELSEHANHSYDVSGQYGFLPQHANLPPMAQWGFDNIEGAWDSDNEPFSAADFSHILVAPGNFIQWQGPAANYPMESVSPISATESIFDWCIQQEDSLKFYIYESWPDMAQYLSNDFPPSESEWINYNDFLNGDFHNWFLEYQDILMETVPEACVKMIPVGPVISQLLTQSPYNEIAIENLYEDDAPHGRPSLYFLASLVTYMAMYEEKAPITYAVASIIDPIIANNYEAVVNLMWDELNDFNFNTGNSRVFCNPPILSSVDELNDIAEVNIYPNPVLEHLFIDALGEHLIDLYDVYGKICARSIQVKSLGSKIDVSFLPAGLYVIVGRTSKQSVLYREKFMKF